MEFIMKKIQRIIPILDAVKKKSLFLLGPRQTGKSSLIRSQFQQSSQINLLLNDDFLRYQKDPDQHFLAFWNVQPR